MTQALAPVQGTTLATGSDEAARLYAAFLASQSASTRAAYAQDFAAFAAFLGETSPTAALGKLLSLGAGPANGVLLDYRTHLSDSHMAPTTINRRLSAIRSAVKLARTLGLTLWKPEIAGVKAQAYRDTAGPGLDGTRAILSTAQAHGRETKAARDAALVRLMFDLGLRRGECVGLDLEDLDETGRRIWILGKGRTQKEPRSLPEPTLAALRAWLAVRDTVAPPEQRALFVSLAKPSLGRRITGDGVHDVISALGRQAGIRTRPHGLRHASITAALDMNNGDVRAAQQHARHSKPETTMLYDDNRKDLAGRVADTLAKVL